MGEARAAHGKHREYRVSAAEARLIKLNGDGSIPDASNLDTPISTKPTSPATRTARCRSRPTGARSRREADPTQIKITDGDGKSVGNGASGGACQYPTRDQVADPKGNPMTMAMDKSNFHDNSFSK